MNLLVILQIGISVALIALILIQQSGSGGLGVSLGGTSSYHTKRGVEKGLFATTIVLAVLFTVVSLAAIIVKST